MDSLQESNLRQETWLRLFPELQAEYPGKIVALRGAEVVAVSSDPFAMYELLDRLGLRSPEDVDVEYVFDGTEKELVPSHADTTLNMHEVYNVVRGGELVDHRPTLAARKFQ